jgi:hypothetical protein
MPRRHRLAQSILDISLALAAEHIADTRARFNERIASLEQQRDEKAESAAAKRPRVVAPPKSVAVG